MSTTEPDNQKIVREMNEAVWGEGALELIDEYVAEDYVEHNTASPQDIHGPDGYRENVEMVRAAFPDLDVTVEDLITDGDTVAYRYTIVGTHEGPFMGIDPTGVEVEIAGAGIARIEAGQLVEGWSNVDVMGTMQQLGVVEPPGEQSDDEDSPAPTTHENEALVQRFVRELVNGKNYDLADELFTADYTRHDPDAPIDEQGPDPFVEALKQQHEAFPDLEVHVGEIIAEGNLVAFAGTLTGTHEGNFRGIEPTNTEIEISGNAMHRVRDGRIAETWATWNYLGALQQLGVVEPPGEEG